MMWGVLFAIGHTYSLYLYLRENAEYELGEQDNATYESLFQPSRFTKYHFLQVPCECIAAPPCSCASSQPCTVR